MIDRSGAKPERHELSPRDDAVLARCELGDLPVTRGRPTWATFTMHLMVDVARVRH